MFNNNRVTMEIGGEEYILSLNRKGIEAIEKYTKLSKKRNEIEKASKRIEYVDEISINEDPFADISEENLEETNNNIEMLKRILWILLWDNHHKNIEEVRELMIKIIDEEKLGELNDNISKLVENANKEMQGNDLKKLKALTAQK